MVWFIVLLVVAVVVMAGSWKWAAFQEERERGRRWWHD